MSASRGHCSGRRRLVVGVLGALGLLVPLAAPSPAGATPHPVPVVAIVVKLASSRVHAASVLGSLPGGIPTVGPAHRYLIHLASGEAPAVLARLRADHHVAYASEVTPVHATALTPNDTCYVGECPALAEPNPGETVGVSSLARQSNLAVIGAPAAWAITHGSSQVLVAILDSGVDPTQPDLQGKVIQGPDICASDNACTSSPNDHDGHGTHVTGIVAAATNNGMGVASLGWNTEAEMFKVLDRQGSGNSFDLATGVYDAVASGARVINLSVAGTTSDIDEFDAVEYALDHGVVVVAAAGNDFSSGPDYPASYPGVLSVAATNNSGVVQPFSEYGAAANIAAPGVSVVSTWLGGEYATLTGTSMAAPQVAAAAALIAAAVPGASGPQITADLQTSAAPLAGGDPIDGGLLDVPAALKDALGHRLNGVQGYDAAGADGSVYSFGAALSLGDLRGQALNRPVVGIATNPSGLGYWMDATDGGVFSFGDAQFHGSMGGRPLNRPVVGMASSADGGGYWLVASDGGIFGFGDVGFYGSTGNIHLNQPIVGMAAAPNGRGYWLVASDGGIFAFGDVGFYGSTGDIHLNQPIVGMAVTPDGRGYWLVASDGGVFAFGDAGFYGSTGNIHLNQPIVGMAASPDGRGYWLVASDGGIFNFGDAPYDGSAAASSIPAPVVGLAS
ncbi:MAG: S8 family serine peptidase [Acidimicrobiales bacterium]